MLDEFEKLEPDWKRLFYELAIMVAFGKYAEASMFIQRFLETPRLVSITKKGE